MHNMIYWWFCTELWRFFPACLFPLRSQVFPLRSTAHQSLVGPELICCLFFGSMVTFSHIILRQEERKLSEDASILGSLLLCWFLSLFWIQITGKRLDPQAWPQSFKKSLCDVSPSPGGPAGNELIVCCWWELGPLGWVCTHWLYVWTHSREGNFNLKQCFGQELNSQITEKLTAPGFLNFRLGVPKLSHETRNQSFWDKITCPLLVGF